VGNNSRKKQTKKDKQRQIKKQRTRQRAQDKATVKVDSQVKTKYTILVYLEATKHLNQLRNNK
jgi:hypothetical protein